MSAGSSEAAARVSNDLGLLAPGFHAAVHAALADCAARGLDAYVYEGYRSAALQAIYYARGRTVIPPVRPVTNAASNRFSWHGYCLAVDVISREHAWGRPDSWFAAVAESFIRAGCRWGGQWTQRDLPHFQWGRCRPSPSDRARLLLRNDGVEAVWAAVGAT